MSYTYDPASNLATATYPNGLQSIFTYDQLDRLTAMATPVSGYTYQLGPTGNRTSATELNGRTLSWSYDGIYRLTNETISNDPTTENGSVAYGLDPVGNRLSASSSLSGVSSSSSSYNTDDELSTNTYDNNGNTTQSGVNSFTYNSENELTTMNGSAVTLLYDGDGNRAAKNLSGVTTHYLVDDLNPTGLPQVVDELVGGSVQRTYTYGLARISENQLVSGTWTPSFYGQDGAGSVRQLTNAAGSVTDTYEYDAFGNEVNHTGTTPNNYLYRGEQYDPDLSLYYLRARYLNPATGRFLSVDALAGEGQRRYEYADADPVNGMDPTGNDTEEEYGFLSAWTPIPVPFPNPSWCGAAASGPMGGYLPLCGSPGNPPPPCAKCFAQLKYRAVDNPWAQKIHATHSFWYVQDSAGEQFTLSGGPWPLGCKEPNCKLHEWATPYPNNSADALSRAGTSWSIGPSSSVCPQVDALVDAADSFPNDMIVYHWYGPNSNTSAHYVGHAGGFRPPPPPVAIGWWNTAIP